MTDASDPRPPLTLAALLQEAATFAEEESTHDEPALYGVTDGKAVGTYLEHKFRIYLDDYYRYMQGNSAKGIDFPELEVDIKVTSIRQPQSSSPYRSARQKIYGLGYHLVIFVYEKMDDVSAQTARLNILHTIFLDKTRTADYQMSRGIREIISSNGNIDDLVAFMLDKALPVDDIEATKIAEELLAHPPEQGYLTISNALQWRLQYRRVIDLAGNTDGITRIR